MPHLDRCQRGDTQNSNEALHHLEEGSETTFASPDIIELTVAIAVLQRNCGTGGLQKIPYRIGVDPTMSTSLFENIDARRGPPSHHLVTVLRRPDARSCMGSRRERLIN